MIRPSPDGVVPEGRKLLLRLGDGSEPRDVTEEVDELARVCDLAAAYSAPDEARDAGFRDRVRVIGEALHRTGGLDAMMAVHDAFIRLAGRERASLVEAWWDGVGDWRW